jgi:hypothetical protein
MEFYYFIDAVQTVSAWWRLARVGEIFEEKLKPKFSSPTGDECMTKKEELNKTFHIIIEKMIATGQAPHYTEIAAGLGVSPAQGRKTLRRLFSSLGFPGWLYPKTDAIVSFAPFNNLPTQYRISIDGVQKWFGQ